MDVFRRETRASTRGELLTIIVGTDIAADGLLGAVDIIPPVAVLHLDGGKTGQEQDTNWP